MLLTHALFVSGYRTVRLNASNPVSHVYREITFQLQRGVGPVCLYTHTPLSRNNTIDMMISPGWIGTDACYYVQFGPPVPEAADREYYILQGCIIPGPQAHPSPLTYPSMPTNSSDIFGH